MANKEYKPNAPPLSKDEMELKRYLTVELQRIAEMLNDIDKRLKAGGL